MIKIDNVIGVIKIRASIETKKELKNLIERLQAIWPHEDEDEKSGILRKGRDLQIP